jgi:hypothetical protein
MEIAGLVLGAAGLAGLYGTCVQVLDQFNASRNLERDLNPLYARLTATIHLLHDWGDKNGIKDGVLGVNPHPAFKDESASRALYLLLANVENMMADQKRLAERYGMEMEIPSSDVPTTMGTIRRAMSRVAVDPPARSVKLRIKWAITDRAKFSGLVGELEGIIDRLFTLAPPRQTLAFDDTNQRLEALGELIKGQWVKMVSFRAFDSYIRQQDRTAQRL